MPLLQLLAWAGVLRVWLWSAHLPCQEMLHMFSLLLCEITHTFLSISNCKYALPHSVHCSCFKGKYFRDKMDMKAEEQVSLVNVSRFIIYWSNCTTSIFFSYSTKKINWSGSSFRYLLIALWDQMQIILLSLLWNDFKSFLILFISSSSKLLIELFFFFSQFTSNVMSVKKKI